MRYKHAEAFCVMTYQCEKCGRLEQVWNSRDGVTPFIIGCNHCGGESKHINWKEDMPDENYIPHRGQRIFIDMPESIKRPLALHRIERFKNSPYRVDEKEKEEVVKAIINSFHPGEPYLIQF